MKILVINLSSASQRLQFQSKQLEKLGLNFERIEACEAPDTRSLDHSKRASQWQRPMRPSEIACLQSHEKAWQIIAEGQEPGLVLEDDALLSSYVPQALEEITKIPELEHVTLEARGRKKTLAKSARPLTANVNLVRLYQDRTGAAAYIISPVGAKKLLTKSTKAAGLADAIIASSYNLSSWQTDPALAIQLDQSTIYGLNPPIDPKTSIGTNFTPKPMPINTFDALGFKVRRIWAQLRMGLRQLSVLTIARRRHVAVEIDSFQAHIQPKD